MAGEAAAAIWAALFEEGTATAVGEAGAFAGSGAASAGASAAAGTSFGTALAQGAAAAAVGTGLSTLLAPKAPGARAAISMPDQQSMDEEKRRSLVTQLARSGRQSTILTDQQDTLG